MRPGTNHRNLRGYRWERRPCPHCGKDVAVHMRLLSEGKVVPIRPPHSRGECVKRKGYGLDNFAGIVAAALTGGLWLAPAAAGG